MRNLQPAVDLIKEFEGLRLKAYRDPNPKRRIPTIGYGTTVYPDGKPVKMGDTIDKQQAYDFLMHDVMLKSKGVDDSVKVHLNNNQYCALVSFSYNVGIGAFKTSTLLRKLNAGDYHGAALEFKRWNKSGGKVLNGLIRRRKSEEALFRKSVGTVKDPVQEIETPSWFEPFKKIIIKLVEAIFGKTGNKTPDIPTGPETKTFSKGTGPRITREECIKILKAKGANVDSVCLLGIRGYYLDSMGAKGANDRGIYDDALIWVFPDGFMTFKANTDPSRYRKGSGFGSKKGMANLKTGHWSYKMGMHNGSVPHPAFRQAAKVTVLRDGNPNYENTGWFGINIHRGGYSGTSSLGCQTVPREQWASFKALGYDKLKEYNQSTFSYVLIHENERR